MSPADKPKSRRWRKIAITLTIVVVVVVYAWLFGFQTFIAVEVHYLLRKMPFEKVVPSALPDVAVSQSAGTSLQYFGYNFDVPWTDLNSESVEVDKTHATIPLRSGLLLRFYSMSNHELIDGLSETTGVKADAFRAVYGEASMRSDYDLLRRFLYTTPRDVTPFISRKAAVSGLTLLVIKEMYVPEPSGIYEVTAGQFRGFQYGDVTKHPWKIVVDLYSGDRGVEFLFYRKDHAPLNLSQADINCVIQSLAVSGGQPNKKS
jgi:hypothetical protein